MSMVSQVAMKSLLQLEDADPDYKQVWETSDAYLNVDLKVSTTKFAQVMELLLERPNLNSTHLFRADILFDSASRLQTLLERERGQQTGRLTPPGAQSDVCSLAAPSLSGFTLQRTVIRRLIPRKPRRDHALEQSCFVYANAQTDAGADVDQLVVYLPHITRPDEMPWYHPGVKALAYLLEQEETRSKISVHYLPFKEMSDSTPDRLHRTFLALLQTTIRLLKLEPSARANNVTTTGPVSSRSVAPSAIKDTILPQHVVQNTYARLKETYATDLIDRWVEKTEPSKHVFEDLSIAAFLIELWRSMYEGDKFPGFIDLACGNGVLTYILIQEGYTGKGFDARKRKTWDILGIPDHLEECLCIPKPFLESLGSAEAVRSLVVHDGVFEPGTFIISNHADELTLWTPIMAAISCPATPLPFLAIPCCSHSLGGARHRYNLRDIDVARTTAEDAGSLSTRASNHNSVSKGSDVDGGNDHQDEQSSKGDLRALHAQKQKRAAHSDDKSQYACLTKKLVALAEEIGFLAEMTLMRIPSTRNIAVVGNRKILPNAVNDANEDYLIGPNEGIAKAGTEAIVKRLIKRECSHDGGVASAAQTWVVRAKKLNGPGERGKVNLGHKPTS